MKDLFKGGDAPKFEPLRLKRVKADAMDNLLPEGDGVEFVGGLAHLQSQTAPAQQKARGVPAQSKVGRDGLQVLPGREKAEKKKQSMWEMFDSASDAVMEFLFPSHCPLCGAYVEKRGAWCVPCLQRTLYVRRLTIATELRPLISEAWGLGYYHGVLGNLVRKLKYEKDMSAQPPLTALLSGAPLPDAFKERLKEPTLLAVPVPLFAAKEKERGFNQTELVFRPWLEETGLSWGRAVVRTRATLPQFGLDVAARRRNLRKAFAVPEEWKQVLAGRQVLLLDDIMTSGSTLAECAAAVRAAGATDVVALVLASGRRPEAKLDLGLRWRRI